MPVLGRIIDAIRTGGVSLRERDDTVPEVNVAPLERILAAIDPGGYLSNELGVAWIDDGTGVARKLVGRDAR